MKNRNNLVAIILVWFPVVFFSSGSSLCWANEAGSQQQTRAVTAQLVIDGKFIISLVLEDEKGRLTALGSKEDASVYRPAGTNPRGIDTFMDLPDEGQTVSLAPGKYRLNTIKLQEPEKNLKFYSNNPIPESIELIVNKTTTLKIGAPLRHTVTTGRLGGTLKLDYLLLGAAGEKYLPVTESSSGQSVAANFTVLKGNHAIFSGSFRYG
jgi:hypothetical protein